MRRARWLAPWKDSPDRPAVYHCISRVVDRKFVFGEDEREKFRTFIRMQEKFSGCRVLAYCVMSNHFHVLLEVPPMPEGGISDEELLQRLGATSTEAFVADVAKELREARAAVAEGRMRAEYVAEIHARFTYRMHSLSEFMKALLIRFTRWFNRKHDRCGTLWEERFKSVIVESGIAARTMAVYIDLNPVRAGIVKDPADYRWSSYGEAVGGGPKGNGKKAREGLVRACMAHEGAGFDASRWPEVSRIYRWIMGMALGKRRGNAGVLPAEAGAPDARRRGGQVTKNTAEMLASQDNETVLPDLGFAEMLGKRVRYFTDGAVIGSKGFVNELFVSARKRFTAGRKDGARRLRGAGKAAAGVLWSARNLRVRI
jgi:REP element-mobilizing transposase RayT